MKRLLVAVLVVMLAGVTDPHAQVTRYVYLSPVDGDGSDATPFISRCVGERVRGAGNIDLRPWGINRFLCASDDLPVNTTGLVRLGDAMAERMTDQRKAALEALLGKPLTETGVREIIREVLLPKLRAGRDGKIKIWLGEKEPLVQQTAWVPFYDNGLVADVANYAASILEPAVAWATTLSLETFPTNGNLNGSTQVHGWTEFNGTALDVSSTAARGQGTATVEARADVDLATDDMEVYATITGSVTGGSEIRVGVIGRKDSTTTRDFYAAHGVYSATPEYRLIKRVAGASTTLGTNAQDPVDGDVVKLRSDGSSQSAYVNGVELVSPVTDTAITGNTRAGIMYIGNNASDVATLDNWQAYDYPLPTPSRTRGGSLWLP